MITQLLDPANPLGGAAFARHAEMLNPPMPTLKFRASRPTTVGVELELQVIDKSTLDLSLRSAEILARLGRRPWLQPELLQGMLEINSNPRVNVREVEGDLRTALHCLAETAELLDLALAGGGTHPTAKHWERTPHSIARFHELIDRNQFVARRLMIFGMHVHIGVESGDLCIGLMNELLYELPVFLALSASSPFWESIDTGLASARSTIFEAIPTGGHPCVVSTWADFHRLASNLIRARSIRNVKDIWWDIRPSPGYGTLEIRVCDMMPTLEENMAIAALIHATACERYECLKRGRARPPLQDWIARENKWRAARHGVDAELITDSSGGVTPIAEVAKDLLRTLEPRFLGLEYSQYLPRLANILAGHASYQRQTQILAATGHMKDVTRHLVAELNTSIENS